MLSSLSHLRSVDLTHSKVESLAPLDELAHLKNIRVAESSKRRAEIRRFRKKRPKVYLDVYEARVLASLTGTGSMIGLLGRHDPCEPDPFGGSLDSAFGIGGFE